MIENDEEDEYFFVLTEREWAERIYYGLKELDTMIDELHEQAKLGRFTTHKLHNAWMAAHSGIEEPYYAMIKELEKKENETGK